MFIIYLIIFKFIGDNYQQYHSRKDNDFNHYSNNNQYSSKFENNRNNFVKRFDNRRERSDIKYENKEFSHEKERENFDDKYNKSYHRKDYKYSNYRDNRDYRDSRNYNDKYARDYKDRDYGHYRENRSYYVSKDSKEATKYMTNRRERSSSSSHCSQTKRRFEEHNPIVDGHSIGKEYTERVDQNINYNSISQLNANDSFKKNSYEFTDEPKLFIANSKITTSVFNQINPSTEYSYNNNNNSFNNNIQLSRNFPNNQINQNIIHSNWSDNSNSLNRINNTANYNSTQYPSYYNNIPIYNHTNRLMLNENTSKDLNKFNFYPQTSEIAQTQTPQQLHWQLNRNENLIINNTENISDIKIKSSEYINPINLLSNNPLPIRNEDTNLISNKSPADMFVLQDNLKIDINTFTAIFALKNLENRKFIAKLANQTSNQIEDTAKKVYQSFCENLVNDVDNEDKFMEPSNVPVLLIDENKFKSSNDAILFNNVKYKHLRNDISSVKKRIEKENIELEILKEKIENLERKDILLKHKQFEIRNTLDEIFSEY